MSRRDEILARVRAMPSLPMAATRVLHIVQNPESSVADLQHAVELEPTLASNTLRLANSAYFGGRGAIASIREAIVRLGTERIFQLSITSSVAPYTKPAIRGYGIGPGGLLRHSAATAIAAEQIASALNLNVPEYCYTAGLLHDIGKIVLGTELEVDAEPILKVAYEDGVSFERAEQKVLGVDHAEVGAVLLECWQLPRSIVDVVRWHHEPSHFSGDGSLVVNLVHLADHVARTCGTSADMDGLNYDVSAEAVEQIGMAPAVAEKAANTILDSLDEICKTLGA